MMNVLFFHTNGFMKRELEELLDDLHGNAYFATTREETVALLNTYPIDFLFLDMKGLADAGLLKYTNEHFQHIRVIVNAEREMEHALTAIKTGYFDIHRNTHSLETLREALTGYKREGRT